MQYSLFHSICFEKVTQEIPLRMTEAGNFGRI